MKKELTKPVSDKDDTAVNLYADERIRNNQCGSGCPPKNECTNKTCGALC
jgi:hypothetical protein